MILPLCPGRRIGRLLIFTHTLARYGVRECLFCSRLAGRPTRQHHLKSEKRKAIVVAPFTRFVAARGLAPQQALTEQVVDAKSRRPFRVGGQICGNKPIQSCHGMSLGGCASSPNLRANCVARASELRSFSGFSAARRGAVLQRMRGGGGRRPAVLADLISLIPRRGDITPAEPGQRDC
jgi:hypothetical protein